MRKQYYFQPSERGLLAWDVDVLIEQAQPLQTHPVALDDIREIDEAYWFGEEGDEPTCRRIVEHMKLVEEADLSYPIILSSQGRVMDGMHRVARALLEGKEAIEAVRFETDPEPQYVGVSPEDLPY